VSLEDPVIVTCAVSGALSQDGSIRVGLEDNFNLPDGAMERSNGDLVAKAREMTLDAGRRPATVAEARAMLGLAARPAGAPAGGVLA
jgi:3-keto-5-aminohexanoate cleavage enzyme